MRPGLIFTAAATAAALTLASMQASAEKREEDGKWLDENDVITYNVQKDGTVDWFTYNGFRRYHSECHVCHGPDGLGSTYAPALADSVKTIGYDKFAETIMSGRTVHKADGSESVMPAFGDNMNIACYVEDIYAYLLARASGELGRGRPASVQTSRRAQRKLKVPAAKTWPDGCQHLPQWLLLRLRHRRKPPIWSTGRRCGYVPIRPTCRCQTRSGRV
jgi:methanol metabolism-related c-type cytochrome